ncbi:MAG: hypothetical protein JWM21_2318 [Acidobacteria bacterium]|nr:hypothetical protein [Acidobacteriota bacterium]
MQPFLSSQLGVRATTAGVFSALALTIMFAFVLSQHAQTQNKPLKFDPLTPEEREVATRLAEADARVQKMRGPGRQLLISVELATPKSADQNDETSRHAEVLYYRYEGNQGVLALIDLQKAAVQETALVNGDGVPLAASEVSEAIGLALKNERVLKLLGPDYQRYQLTAENLHPGERNPVEALRVVAASPPDPCYRHRCLSLLFRRGETFLTGTSIIVDLTANNVRVEQAGATPASRGRRIR